MGESSWLGCISQRPFLYQLPPCPRSQRDSLNSLPNFASPSQVYFPVKGACQFAHPCCPGACQVASRNSPALPIFPDTRLTVLSLCSSKQKAKSEEWVLEPGPTHDWQLNQVSLVGSQSSQIKDRYFCLILSQSGLLRLHTHLEPSYLVYVRYSVRPLLTASLLKDMEIP